MLAALVPLHLQSEPRASLRPARRASPHPASSTPHRPTGDACRTDLLDYFLYSLYRHTVALLGLIV